MRLLKKTNKQGTQGNEQTPKAKWSFGSSALPAVIIFAAIIIVPLLFSLFGPPQICKNLIGSSNEAAANPQKSLEEVEKISAKDAKARIDSGNPVVILDVRTEEEYAEAHIPGAILIPNENIKSITPSILPLLDAEILVYCRSGRRSAEAAEKLVGLGYTNVKDFGGIIDWPYETESSTWESKKGTYASFRTSSINGAQVSEDIFADYKVTMINIWATYCGPCLDEMPDLGEISAEYADKGFQIVGIPIDTRIGGTAIFQTNVDKALQLIEQTGANYLHILPSSDLNDAGLEKVSAVPTTIFVDSTGKQIGETYTGSRSKAQWEDIINDLL